MPDRKFSRAALSPALVIVLMSVGLSTVATGQEFTLSYLPLRAPMLAGLCATPDGPRLAARRTGYCAGYVRAVLENDRRLDECHPLLAEVLDEVIAREHRTPLTDNSILARDFVVEVARELCERRRR